MSFNESGMVIARVGYFIGSRQAPGRELQRTAGEQVALLFAGLLRCRLHDVAAVQPALLGSGILPPTRIHVSMSRCADSHHLGSASAIQPIIAGKYARLLHRELVQKDLQIIPLAITGLCLSPAVIWRKT